MELAESGNQHQLQLPVMIIAMKGPSSSKKREVASSLAEFLHYPLIDGEDIVLETTSSSSKSSSTIFKIVTQITKTQLQLKLQVIINASLSDKTHIDQLLELASSNKANLVIVEGTNESGPAHDSWVGHAPVLSIDMSKPFIVKNFASAITDALKFPQKADHKDNSQPQDHKIIPRRILTESHAHEFSFTTEPKTDSTKLRCNYCGKLISGPTYQCIVCDEFIMHKSCAEGHKNSLENSLTILKQTWFYPEPCPSEYKFPFEHKCKLCDLYSSDCNSCLLQSHIKYGGPPTIYRFQNHTHPLNFVIMPFWFSYVYKCIACDKIGKFTSYKCYICNIDLHLSCGMSMIIEDLEEKSLNHGEYPHLGFSDVEKSQAISYLLPPPPPPPFTRMPPREWRP